MKLQANLWRLICLLNSLMFGGARYLGSRQNKLDEDVDA